jgi:hypothetical protein
VLRRGAVLSPGRAHCDDGRKCRPISIYGRAPPHTCTPLSLLIHRTQYHALQHSLVHMLTHIHSHSLTLTQLHSPRPTCAPISPFGGSGWCAPAPAPLVVCNHTHARALSARSHRAHDEYCEPALPCATRSSCTASTARMQHCSVIRSTRCKRLSLLPGSSTLQRHRCSWESSDWVSRL